MTADQQQEKNLGVLCIGILTLDIIARPVASPEKWEEKQGISEIALTPGGDAANQSIHLAGLGHHSMLCSCIGADINGETLSHALKSRGVDCGYLRRKSDTPTGTALILVNEEGERRVFSMHGAHSTLCRTDLPQQIPEDCRAVSLGSLFSMPQVESDGLEDFLKEAVRRGIPVFADLSTGRIVPRLERVWKLLPYVDYFLPSSYDILPLTGRKTQEDAVKEMQEIGIANVVVKCGEKGCRIYSPSCTDSVPAVRVSPVDTTGAGDCMNAAFISRIIQGDDIRTASEYACAAGSLSTLYPGACGVHLTDDAVRTFMKDGLSVHM